MHKVLFIDDGIEFDSKLVRQKAFGGAEVAFVSLAEALAKLNFKVTVYNNCKHNGEINKVLVLAIPILVGIPVHFKTVCLISLPTLSTSVSV